MDEAQLPPTDNQSDGPEGVQPSDATPDSEVHTPASNEHDALLEDPLLEEQEGWSAQFVVPFQQSGPLPTMHSQAAQASLNGAGAPAHRRGATRKFPVFRVILIVTIIVLGGGFLAITVFAQPAPHLVTTAKNPTQGSGAPVIHTAPTARPTRTAVQRTPIPTMTTATAQTTPQTTQATPQGDWIPSAQTLQQFGWTGAGLSMGDALEGERTAWTFTDREMSLDFRNAGTRAQHGGTFTAAAFLLTPNARTRFFANDVRAINNVLFDRVAQQHLIQEVVNAQPRLVQFQGQGQQEFAWVNVSFQLWQSRLDRQTGQRNEGLELDPATNGPRIHHMIVLLLRVPPGTQGANAPMGGAGWLVSTYTLDPAGGTLPAIPQPA
jgi:hypothetical protein